MLPSPVSSTPIKRHESPLCLQKTGALASISLEFGEGGKRARGSEDEQSSNAQPEEEVRSFQEYPMPIEHASSGPMEGEIQKAMKIYFTRHIQLGISPKLWCQHGPKLNSLLSITLVHVDILHPFRLLSSHILASHIKRQWTMETSTLTIQLRSNKEPKISLKGRF